MTLSCDDIYSAFLSLIDDYNIPQMDKDDAYEYMKDCFKNVFSKPKIRKLFSSISFDDNILQLNYVLRNSVDEGYDEEFVKGLFANGMVIQWVEQRYQSESLTAFLLGTKESKYYSQSAHIDSMAEMYNKARMIVDKDYSRDHGYAAMLINGGLS